MVIRGGRPLHGGTYTSSCRTASRRPLTCARAASAGGEVFLPGRTGGPHLSAVTAVLREAGCDVTGGSAGIVCRRIGRLTAPPAHPHGSLSRFSHRRAGHFDGGAAAVPGGGGIRGKPVRAAATAMWMSWPAWEQTSGCPDGRRWCCGVERLHGAAVRCTDLRGGAALCAAALAAEGETSISDIDPYRPGLSEHARMIWRRWARIYGGWRRRPPPERQTVKENHHGKTERIGAAAQKGRQRLPL